MKKIISAIVLLSALSILTTASFAVTNMQIFADVNSDETYKTGIEFLYSEGIVNGYPDGTYQPQRTLNRAEMIKIIAEGMATLSDWPANTFTAYASQTCFDDVAANQWYTKYVCYGKEHNWVVGYDGGKNFKPDQTVTFVEGLKIAYKGFGLTYSENSSPWYRDVVESASRENYIPFDITAFSNGFKRNQMADLATRIIKGEESAETLSEYLSDRENKVVTYETIEAGINVRAMEVEIEEPGEEDDADMVDDTADIDDDSMMAADDDADGMVGTVCTSEALICWDGSSVGRELPDCEFAACPRQTTITITSSGFSPSSLDILVGDTVTFINEDTSSRWPASASHPNHTVYPGSSVSKCGGDEAIFDACHGLAVDETFEFTFNEIGTWNYHDHLSPSTTGSITVSQLPD